jgi:acetyl esterase/lipase
MATLAHLQQEAERLHVDPTRFVLAGDSAGSHITAQVAAAISDADYASRAAITPTVQPDHLRGVVLCCGIYDLRRDDPSSPVKDLFRGVRWAYSGQRQPLDDSDFTWATTLTERLTGAFPAAFLTVGSADPLAPQSRQLAARLADLGVAVETVFYPPDHQPALAHEYQFDLALADARAALDRILAFARRCTAAS